MNEIVLFLFESSVILGVMYLIYFSFLKKEASFHFNRFFLLGSVLLSLVLPFLSLEVSSLSTSAVDQPIKQLSEVRTEYQQSVEEWSNAVFDQDFSVLSTTNSGPAENANRLLEGLAVVYIIGLIAMLTRFVWTLTWITNLRLKYPKERKDGIIIVKVPYQVAPFSFLNSVFVQAEMLDSEEFVHILDHEKTHVKQKHSYDLLIVQLLTALLWFNPVVWWLNKSLKSTHEYIADRNMIKKGYSLVEYQTLLLRQLVSNNSFGLVHHFNLSFIKQRITMMNIQRIGHLGKFKVAAVIALTLLFSLVIVQCNSKLEEQEITLSEELSVELPLIETEYTYDVKEHLRFDIIIKNDQIYFKDRLMTLKELSDFDGNFPEKVQMVLTVSKTQKMKLVHEVQEVLREKDLNLLVYQGENSSNDVLNVPFMMPPRPGSKSGVYVPELTDEFIRERKLDLLRVHLGSSTKISSEVIDRHVRKHVKDGLGNYVVIGNYGENEFFGDYLTNLVSIKQGFYDIYDERAQDLFGVSFYEINRAQEQNEEAKQQYREVRKGIPMAISIEKL